MPQAGWFIVVVFSEQALLDNVNRLSFEIPVFTLLC